MLKTKSDKQKQKIVLINFIFFTVTFLLVSCNTTQPPPGSKGAIQLTVEDVSSTEVWLNVKTQNINLPAELKLFREDSVTRIINLPDRQAGLGNTDTLLYDNDLQPNKTYNYKAIIQSLAERDNQSTISSEAVTAATMDTTSNNFTWQLYSFGNFNASGMSSELYDVAIINPPNGEAGETEIWAVGEIHTAETDQFDSSGVWVQPYNAVHWDGNSWVLKRIKTNSCGGVKYPPIKTIFAFSSDDILLVHIDGSISHYNGIEFTNDCSLITQLNGSANAIWGLSNQDFYVVSNNGFIAHYNGNGWAKIESGTSYDCYDIYSGNGTDIYVSGGDLFQDTGGILLQTNINGTKTIEEGKSLHSSTELFNPYFDGIAKTVWVSKTGTIYFGGSWLYKSINGKTSFEENLSGNYWGGNTSGQYYGFISKIRGIAENQIMLVGERNTIRYFNGANWKQLGMPYNTNSNYTWLSVGMTNNLIVVVGYATGNGTVNGGTIMMLKR